MLYHYFILLLQLLLFFHFFIFFSSIQTWVGTNSNGNLLPWHLTAFQVDTMIHHQQQAILHVSLYLTRKSSKCKCNICKGTILTPVSHHTKLKLQKGDAITSAEQVTAPSWTWSEATCVEMSPLPKLITIDAGASLGVSVSASLTSAYTWDHISNSLMFLTWGPVEKCSFAFLCYALPLQYWGCLLCLNLVVLSPLPASNWNNCGCFFFVSSILISWPETRNIGNLNDFELLRPLKQPPHSAGHWLHVQSFTMHESLPVSATKSKVCAGSPMETLTEE